MNLFWCICLVTILSIQAFAPIQRRDSSLPKYVPRKLNVHSAVKSLGEASSDEVDDDDGVSLEAFQKRKNQREPTKEKQDNLRDFDGYCLRDVIYEKWGLCYDVDFNRVDSFGFRKLYLNVLPFHLGGRRFRHKTELDYLCHLQAVVEILEKYEQLDYILTQIEETNKKPRAGTSPLVAVPLRLDLTREQAEEIIGY
jgi:hypothetical protein